MEIETKSFFFVLIVKLFFPCTQFICVARLLKEVRLICDLKDCFQKNLPIFSPDSTSSSGSARYSWPVHGHISNFFVFIMKIYQTELQPCYLD